MNCGSKALLSTLLCFGASSCIRVTWSRAEFGSPLAPEAVESLVDGQSDLTECLAQLGSPLLVWELSEVEYALAYGWDKDSGWGGNISVPLGQEFSASMDFDDLSRKLHGLVLVFDAQDRLVYRRRGFLADIAVEARRRRPALIESSANSDANRK